MSTIKTGQFNLTIITQPNKAVQTAIVGLVIKTDEHKLLAHLLDRFVHEKIITGGVTKNIKVFDYKIRGNGIVFTCVESAITKILITLFNFLLTSKVPTSKQKLIGRGDYTKLHKDIFNATIEVVGKCKNFDVMITEKNEKYESLVKSFGLIKVKEFEKFDCSKVSELGQCEIDTKLSVKGKMYFTIACDLPLLFNKSKLILYGPLQDLERELSFVDVYGKKIKTFLDQAGRVSKKDDEKAKLTMETQMSFIKLLLDISGIDIKDVKNPLDFDKDVIKEIAKMI